jgi:hypothetical protein
VTTYMAARRPLWALRTPDRILITLFSITLTVALMVGVINYQKRTQLTVRGTQEWYRGNEGDPDPAVLKFPKTTLELLDVTHPHLFFQTIMFFLLCHIFSLTQASDGLKVTLYSVAFGSVLTEAGLPWLIRYLGGAFAPFLLVSTFVLTGTILTLLVVPIKEMWWPRNSRRLPGESPEPGSDRRTYD